MKGHGGDNDDDDYDEGEEIESLIVDSNTSGQVRSLEKSTRKSSLYFGFLTVVLVILVTFVAFLWGAGEARSTSTSDPTQVQHATSTHNATTPSDGAKQISTTVSLGDHDEIAAQQVNNFLDGNGLLLNVHVTHHGEYSSRAIVGLLRSRSTVL